MKQQRLANDEMKEIRTMLRAKRKAETALASFISSLEEKYDFSLEVDDLNLPKGIITYASNEAESLA